MVDDQEQMRGLSVEEGPRDGQESIGEPDEQIDGTLLWSSMDLPGMDRAEDYD